MPRHSASDASVAKGRDLAAALRLRRQAADLSAEALARAAGLSVETVRRIERGLVPNPGVFTVAALAQALGIGIDPLVETEVRTPSHPSKEN